MDTTSFDTIFRINHDCGVKNLKNGLDEYKRTDRNIHLLQ